MSLLDSYLKQKGIVAEQPKQETVQEQPVNAEPQAAGVGINVVTQPKQETVQEQPKPKKRKRKTKKVEETKQEIVVAEESKAIANVELLSADLIAKAIIETDEIPGINDDAIENILDYLPIRYLKIESKDPNLYGKIIYGKDENTTVLNEPLFVLFSHTWRQLSDEKLQPLCQSVNLKTGYEGKKCSECPMKNDGCKLNTTVFFIDKAGNLYTYTYRQGFGTNNLAKIKTGGKRWVTLKSQLVEYENYKFMIADSEEAQGDKPTNEMLLSASQIITKHINRFAKKIANS